MTSDKVTLNKNRNTFIRKIFDKHTKGKSKEEKIKIVNHIAYTGGTIAVILFLALSYLVFLQYLVYKNNKQLIINKCDNLCTNQHTLYESYVNNCRSDNEIQCICRYPNKNIYEHDALGKITLSSDATIAAVSEVDAAPGLIFSVSSTIAQTSGFNAIGGLKWEDIIVPGETWTDQTVTTNWTDVSNPSTAWNELDEQEAA